MGEGSDESLKQSVETLSEKNEAKDSARDGLGVEDGSEVVCLRCCKEFMFFYRRHGLGIDDGMSCALNSLLA